MVPESSELDAVIRRLDKAESRIKSVILIGTFLFLCAVTTWAWLRGIEPRTGPAWKPEVGRYQLVMHPNVGKFQYLLDTATGTVWVVTEFTDIPGKPCAWEKMGRIDTLSESTMQLLRMRG